MPDLISEKSRCEVIHVEVVDTNVAVLPPSGEAAAIWRESNTIDGAKVATHIAKLLGINLMVEPRLKPSCFC